MKTEKLSFGFEPIPPERTFQKKVWFPHRQQVGTSGIEPLSRQTRWIFSRCLSIRPCVYVHRIPSQKYPMPLQFFFKCNFAAKSTHADCCVKSPPGFEPGTYSKKGLKEKLLFHLSYDDIFVAVSVKSGYDNSYFPAATARKLAGWDSNPRTNRNRFTVGLLWPLAYLPRTTE